MLRPDVVEACEAGTFHVYAVDTIHEALELLTGCAAGERDDDGHYPPDSVLGKAEAKAGMYWRMMAARPAAAPPTPGGEGEGAGDGDGESDQGNGAGNGDGDGDKGLPT
jgi:hypothetical protein